MKIGNFFKYWSDTENNVTVLDAIVGLGKTKYTVDYLSGEYFDETNKVIYAAETINQLLEVILRFRRARIGSGARKDNVDLFLFKKSRFCFNFNGSDKTDLKKVAELMNSDSFTEEEKNFVRKINCQTNKYTTQLKLVFATHSSVFCYSHLFNEFNVIFDETPAFASEIVKSDKKAVTVRQLHIDIVDMAGSKYIDPTLMSRAVYHGLVNIQQHDSKHINYCLNKQLPFKKTLIMTSFAKAGLFGRLIEQYEWELISVDENEELRNLYMSKLDFKCLNEKLRVSNKDSDSLYEEALKSVINPSRAFKICTSNQSVGVEIQSIRTNKKGINSLSNCNECVVLTQLNFSSEEKSLFDNDLAFERTIQGTKLVQSIFRGCIRKREKMTIYVASSEAQARIYMAMNLYKKDNGSAEAVRRNVKAIREKKEQERLEEERLNQEQKEQERKQRERRRIFRELEKERIRQEEDQEGETFIDILIANTPNDFDFDLD